MRVCVFMCTSTLLMVKCSNPCGGFACGYSAILFAMCKFPAEHFEANDWFAASLVEIHNIKQN